MIRLLIKALLIALVIPTVRADWVTDIVGRVFTDARVSTNKKLMNLKGVKCERIVAEAKLKDDMTVTLNGPLLKDCHAPGEYDRMLLELEVQLQKINLKSREQEFIRRAHSEQVPAIQCEIKQLQALYNEESVKPFYGEILDEICQKLPELKVRNARIQTLSTRINTIESKIRSGSKATNYSPLMSSAEILRLVEEKNKLRALLGSEVAVFNQLKASLWRYDDPAMDAYVSEAISDRETPAQVCQGGKSSPNFQTYAPIRQRFQDQVIAKMITQAQSDLFSLGTDPNKLGVAGIATLLRESNWAKHLQENSSGESGLENALLLCDMEKKYVKGDELTKAALSISSLALGGTAAVARGGIGFFVNLARFSSIARLTSIQKVIVAGSDVALMASGLGGSVLTATQVNDACGGAELSGIYDLKSQNCPVNGNGNIDMEKMILIERRKIQGENCALSLALAGADISFGVAGYLSQFRRHFGQGYVAQETAEAARAALAQVTKRKAISERHAADEAGDDIVVVAATKPRTPNIALIAKANANMTQKLQSEIEVMEEELKDELRAIGANKDQLFEELESEGPEHFLKKYTDLPDETKSKIKLLVQRIEKDRGKVKELGVLSPKNTLAAKGITPGNYRNFFHKENPIELSDQERIFLFEQYAGLKLSENDAKILLELHLRGKGYGEYSIAELRAKANGIRDVLRRNGITEKQKVKSTIDLSLRQGLFGKAPVSYDPETFFQPVSLAGKPLTPTEIAEDALKDDSPATLANYRRIGLDDAHQSASLDEQLSSIRERSLSFPPPLEFRQKHTLVAEVDEWNAAFARSNPSPFDNAGKKLFRSVFGKTEDQLSLEMAQIDAKVQPKLVEILEQKWKVNALYDDVSHAKRIIEEKMKSLSKNGPLDLRSKSLIAKLTDDRTYLDHLEKELELKILDLDVGIKRAQSHFGPTVRDAAKRKIIEENRIVSTANLKVGPDVSDRLLYIAETNRLRAAGGRIDPEFDAVLSRWIQDSTQPFDLRTQSFLQKLRKNSNVLASIDKSFTRDERARLLDLMANDADVVSNLAQDLDQLLKFFPVLGENKKLFEAGGQRLFGGPWASYRKTVRDLMSSNFLNVDEKAEALKRLQQLSTHDDLGKLGKFIDYANAARPAGLQRFLNDNLPSLFTASSRDPGHLPETLFQALSSQKASEVAFARKALDAESLANVELFRDLRRLMAQHDKSPQEGMLSLAVKKMQTEKTTPAFQELVLKESLRSGESPVKLYETFPGIPKQKIMEAAKNSSQRNVFQARFLELSDSGLGNAEAARKTFLSAHPKSFEFVELPDGAELQATPVTELQWAAILKRLPSRLEKPPLMPFWNGIHKIEVQPNRPVTGVTFEDCTEFIKELNSLDPDYRYRFPTAKELDSIGVKSEITLKGKGLGIRDVAGSDPNHQGLYDLNGNVAHWTATPYGSGRSIAGESSDATMTHGYRFGSPNRSYNDVGFRLIREKKK